MAYIRRRRYAMKPRRSRRLSKKRRTMAILKKDIRKCNFPSKVKFVGLTEKKTMFLYETREIRTNRYSFYLDPLGATNLNSLGYGEETIGTEDLCFANWDKFCVLGIYIRFQPTKNTWAANDANNNIVPIKMTYTMNNVLIKNAQGLLNITGYDHENVNNKQIFTFNSNESFTLYVPAPTTMCFDSPVVHKSKTWWSLTDLKALEAGSRYLEDEENDENEEEGRQGVDEEHQFSMHCGRIYLEGTGNINYNVTINYKVALKG